MRGQLLHALGARGRSSRRGSPWAPKVLAAVGLSGSGLAAVTLAKMSEDESEKIWISRRGPFAWDAQRAVEWVPLVPCIGSGLVAALITYLMPRHLSKIRLPISVHELTALPLSILLAFRFQLSYERWWASRQQLQDVSANAVALAMCAANNQEVIALDSNPTKPCKAEIELNERRLLGLLDTVCAIIEWKLSNGQPPHPSNDVTVWEDIGAHLHPDDLEQLRKVRHPGLWCFDLLFTTIHRGQMLGVYSGELASGMFERTTSMLEGYQFCEMVQHQPNPAPFAVHLRSILLVFCVSFPFTIIGQISPMSLVLMQSALSFSLLGIEFVSREMEHPFGNDESDVPTRKVMGKTRAAIRAILWKHSSHQESLDWIG
ncbi:unnamed protein product [Effrenium voratum]|nr:unnamed protein product [Effrenium voratum]